MSTLEGEEEYLQAKKLHGERLYEAAAEYLNQSIAKGFTPAKTSLGIYYLNAYIRRNTQKGIELLNETAQTGDLKAQECLANYYSHLHGGENESLMLMWAKIAADNGSEKYQVFISDSYSEGKLIEKDTSLSIKYLKMAALQGNEYAQRKLLSGKFSDGFERLDDFLYDAYANLQMLMYALKSRLTKFDTRCYMIRAKAKKAYKDGRWKIHDLLVNNDEKNRVNDSCWYCGRHVDSYRLLTNDHIFPRSKGGDNSWDNIVKVCKTCNSSKSDLDVLEWFITVRKQFPPIYIIVYHLKEINRYAEEHDLMGKSSDELDLMNLPFSWRYVPVKYNLYNEKSIN